MLRDDGFDRHHAVTWQFRDLGPEAPVDDSRRQVEQQVDDPRLLAWEPVGGPQEGSQQLVDLLADAFQGSSSSKQGIEQRWAHGSISLGTGCSASVVRARSATMTISPDDATRRKRLLWRATHRGIKEMDLILGGYVRRNLEAFTSADIDKLEAIMNIPDQEMLSWATKQEVVPPEHASPLLLKILEHRQ